MLARLRQWIGFSWAGGLGYDRVFAVACLLSAAGLGIDVYAHSHGLVPKETFLTWFHAAMYGAYFLVLTLVLGSLFINRAAGRRSPTTPPTTGWAWALPIRRAASIWLPIGYDVTLLGAVIYFVAGAGDAAWHTLLGVERNVEALFSPSHLGLLVGAALFRTGPLRSAWLRPEDTRYQRWSGLWPAIASATFLLFSLMVFTMYVSPFGIASATGPFYQAGAGPSDNGDMKDLLDWVLVAGITGVLLHTVIVMGMVLLLVDRWGTKLPRGTFTIMLTSTTAAIGVIRENFLVTGNPSVPGVLPLTAVAFIAGMLADVLLHWLAPSATRTWQFRFYAMAVPIILYGGYFLALWTFWGGGVWWSFPTWSGLILMPGALGYVMSFLILQPPWSAPKAGGVAPA